MKNVLQLFAVLLIVTGCSSGSEKKDEGEKNEKAVVSATAISLPPDQIRAAGISTVMPEVRNLSGSIKANGTLDVPPQNLVTISAPLAGFIKDTDLLQGMKIKKGQLLVSLEGPEYIQLQEDYLTTKSQLDFLELDYRRQTELANENVNAAKVVQLARANYLSTRAKVEGLREKLKILNINAYLLENGAISNSVNLYAPIAGYVSQVNVNVGMHVNPADVIFRIVDTDHLHAEARVFERDITKLKVGQKVKLLLANDMKERNATVYLIGKEISDDRTIRVHCHLSQEDPDLIPGMYFSAVIETDSKQVLSVPSKSIITFDGKKYIFMVSEHDSSRFEMKEITTGAFDNSYTELISPDLNLKHRLVVTNGAYDLLTRLKNNEK